MSASPPLQTIEAFFVPAVGVIEAAELEPKHEADDNQGNYNQSISGAHLSIIPLS
jgi:hypothetical protein